MPPLPKQGSRSSIKSVNPQYNIMAETKKQDIFTTKVKPVMDRVRDELNTRQAEEMRRHSTSFGAMMACSAGPDGGMAAMDSYNSRLYYIGEWNSKTMDDFIAMVKAELKKQHITVDATLEKRMIDHLVGQKIPQSTADYILRKSCQGTLFYIPQRVRQTSLEQHIDKEAEKKYNPSFLEEASSAVGSWLLNAASTAGVGGFFGQLAVDAGVDIVDRYAPGQQDDYLNQQKAIGKQEVAAASMKKANIPGWMMSQMGFRELAYATDTQLTSAASWADKNAKLYRDRVNQAIEAGQRTVEASGKTNRMSVSDATFRAMQYEAFSKAVKQEQTDRKNGKDAVHYSNISEAVEHAMTTHSNTSTPEQSVQPVSCDYGGWNNLMQSMGLNGMGDTMNNLGFTLAMLPDMLLGVFTGKTKSIGLNQQTMMPLAALICGSFIKNPLLKLPMMLYGGASLFNSMGQEALSGYRKEHHAVTTGHYKRYADEELDKRIATPQIEGSVLLMDIDNVPRIVTLPQSVIEAYHEGALTVNTIANRILAHTDQMTTEQQWSHTSSERYEQSLEREHSRGIR